MVFLCVHSTIQFVQNKESWYKFVIADEMGQKTGRTSKGRIVSNASIVRKEHAKGFEHNIYNH